MRITCPNCGAQYEVPDEVIPTEGRDVQCSNCGDTWFQTHPDFAQDPEPEVIAPPAPPPQPTRPQPTRPQPRAEQQPPQPRPRQMDPGVADILREEAEHESRLRARESTTLESQGDLGLDSLPPSDPAANAREARERMARRRGETPVAHERPRSRLLPDVEEISSTLNAGDKAEATPPPQQSAVGFPVEQPPKRRGFARGFALVLLLAVVLVVAYTQADQFAESVPAAAPALESYVAAVDGLRLWVDTKLGAYIPR
ncbi:zinc-ribbon domain-containing protein [Seohaeicola zhoushanensis]|uniref:Zinc finger/thioredoxin putative domain-containing protein n=1 Tax=Seohaeicola zhoushanensis TaxID=1569283 RepID=A0A8J3GU66_9RHOB|nr:zinc-ribbon domain-containing protein [Seohaeicola zhoushanensis]GHF38025.1 hypothetical protein GCM10017056_07470 [Seohaeicola zhoushanensis]